MPPRYNNNNNSVYLLSAHSIRFYAHGTNYYYPGYARPSQRRTQQTKEKSTTPGSRETIVDKMPCLRAYALGGLEPPTL